MHTTPGNNNEDKLKEIIRLFNQGSFVEVLEMAKSLLDQAPNNVNLLNIYGAAAAITGQFRIAEDALRCALKIDGNNADVNNNLGNVLFRQHKYSESSMHFENAVTAQPENPSFRNNLGASLLLCDRINEAEAVLKTSISLQPSNAEAHANMGNLCWERGNVKDAQNSYLKALSFDPNHEQAKVKMIRTLESHTPGRNINLPTAIANREIRQIIIKRSSENQITDNSVVNTLEQADSILNRYAININYPETQTYRRNQKRLNCHRHENVFHEHNIIPKFCFGCFKVQIEPRTVAELIKLFLLFDWLELDANNSRKCMVELRDNVSGFYKGLIYCSSLAEAETIKNTVTVLVQQSIGKDIPCNVKRGCSEFALSYPEYGNTDCDSGSGLMNYFKEWEVIEKKYNDSHKSDRSPNSIPTLNGFSLSDFLIIKNWIGYARGVGDPSVNELSLDKIGSNRLFKSSSRRKFPYPLRSKAAYIMPNTYNIKPINIG